MCCEDAHIKFIGLREVRHTYIIIGFVKMANTIKYFFESLCTYVAENHSAFEN